MFIPYSQIFRPCLLPFIAGDVCAIALVNFAFIVWDYGILLTVCSMSTISNEIKGNHREDAQKKTVVKVENT